MMNPNDPVQLRDRLEALGSQKVQPEKKKRSATVAGFGLATFALGFGLALLGKEAANAIPTAVDQAGLDWVILEIAEKHDMTPEAAKRLVEGKIYAGN